MTPDEFQHLACDSAIIYFNYLCKYNLGLSEEHPYRIKRSGQSGQYICLYLSRRLPMPDSVYFRIKGIDYEQEKIGECSYDEEKRVLTIKPRPQSAKLFEDISANAICVVSDLKFLVARVRDWYCEKRIVPPDQLPSPQSLNYKAPNIIPSKEQLSALENIFTHNFSYIWGIPGSGKTSVVLSLAVLAYVQAGKRVLIAAPTNNAIEQTLRGVIPVLDRSGINRKLVFRLGIASERFKEDFPEVCEISHAELKYEKLVAERDSLTRYLNLLNYRESLASADRQLTELISALELFEQETTESAAKARKCKSALTKLKHKEKPVLEHYSTLLKTAGTYDRALELLTRRQSSPWHRLGLQFRMRSSNELEKGVDETRKAIQLLGEEIRSCSAQLSEIQNERTSLEEELESLEASQSNRHDLSSVVDAVSHAAAFDKELYDKVIHLREYNYSLTRQNVRNRIQKLKQKVYDALPKYAEYASLSKADVENRLKVVCDNLEQGVSGSSAERMAKCLVLAATTDKIINNVRPERYQPEHVFLDEAAYAPLIKGATLTAFNAPLTLLGDHMQLPPVCEMKDTRLRERENNPVTLWSQSVIYLGDILNQDYKDFLRVYFNSLPPDAEHMFCSFLSKSYRYGERMAQILSENIYGLPLQGISEANTEVFIIDAKKKTSDHFHESVEEMNAIAYAVAQASNDNYAVLTPYRRQRALLTKKLPAEHVFTIHSAQGQEWDTVYLSIANPKPWQFTDSTLLLGKRLLNTACSRVQRKLIIACDINKWKMYPDQFITRLIDTIT